MNKGFYGLPHDATAFLPTVDYARGITPTSNVGYNGIGQITDGNDTTSGNATAGTMPQYVELLLPNDARIGSMRVLYGSVGNAARDGSLLYSLDGVNWLEAYAWSGNTSQALRPTFQPRTAKRWRLQATAPITATFGINIATWSLYGR